MRIHCIQTGVVRPKSRDRGPRRYLPGGWSDRAIPVHAFAVEHPRGVCLFDAGQTARAAAPGYLAWWHPFMWLSRYELTPDQECAPQLERLGIAPSDVRWVVLSHLHVDHVGGLEPFLGAQVFVSRREWDRARGWPGRVRGYLPQHWPARSEPVLVDPGEGGYDIAGDGRLRLLATPGHTRGHMSLLVESTPRVLLGGDAARSSETLDREAPRLAEWCRSHGAVFVGAHDAHAEELLG